jgi:predicted Zn-dependent peptidase
MAPIERIAEHLEKPELDDRSYRVIRLPNKLEALLVHDPDTDKASAAVNVNVGNFSDEDDMPGMAHAVEHLLFMGTKKVSRGLFPVSVGLDKVLIRLAVPQGKRIQPVPSGPLWFIQCIHSRDGNELFL